MTILRIIPVLLLLAGCSRAMHTQPIVVPKEMSPDEKNFQAVWDATSEVLISYRFSVNQRDRRAGLITTEPMVGKHFFELWRPDKTTSSGALENSVQPIYRAVSVRIKKTKDGKYDPAVSIVVSRLLSSGLQRRQAYYDPQASDIEPGEHFILGVGHSDDSPKDKGKRSPGDDLLARKIASDIRLLAEQKRPG